MLANSDLRGVQLAKANLRVACLDGADLRDADLRNADLAMTSLNGTNLQGALLDGIRQEVLDGHTDGVNSVAWSPDGAQLASASDDKGEG